jgi:hypothetical protein
MKKVILSAALVLASASSAMANEQTNAGILCGYGENAHSAVLSLNSQVAGWIRAVRFGNQATKNMHTSECPSKSARRSFLKPA